jgi:FkbM family methyltransferase
LPYNLNWLARDWSPLGSFLNKHPLNVVDVGARGASLGELQPLRKFINYFAFDADSAEASRLESEHDQGFKSFRIFPYFVGGRVGAMTFHLFDTLACSSALSPNPRFLQFAVPGFSVKRSVEVESKTLDSILETQLDEDIDVIKLDTQGTEFEILESSPESLSKALLVEVEVEFFEIYKDQKLFADVCQLMRERGFDLLYLNREFISRAIYKGKTRGQLIFGDALFGRRDDLASSLPVGRKIEYIVALIQYGHLDFAYKLYSEDEAVHALVPEIGRFFKLYRTSPWGKFKRFASMQLDKIIFLLLHARRTNHRGCDSDRSWPIR